MSRVLDDMPLALLQGEKELHLQNPEKQIRQRGGFPSTYIPHQPPGVKIPPPPARILDKVVQMFVAEEGHVLHIIHDREVIAHVYFVHLLAFQTIRSIAVVDDNLTRFRLVGKLGSGATGRVFSAINLNTPGLNYAIKIIPRLDTSVDVWAKLLALVWPTISSSVDGVSDDKILDEHNSASGLAHLAHVAEVIESVPRDDHVSMVMLPVADQGHLGKVLVDMQNIPHDTDEFEAARTQIFQWIYCLAKTLARIHEKGIHGDIKPENILVHDNIVIYSDFGLAKLRMNTNRPEFTSVGSTKEWAPTPPTASMGSVKECQCKCGIEQELQAYGRAPPPQPRAGETMNQIVGLGEPSGDVFHLGWVIYEMLLVATPTALLGTKLLCRPTAKILAWDNIARFLDIVNGRNAPLRIAIPTSRLESAAYIGLTRELLDIVARHMVPRRADGRKSSKEVASLIEAAMARGGMHLKPLADCCEPMAKPW